MSLFYASQGHSAALVDSILDSLPSGRVIKRLRSSTTSCALNQAIPDGGPTRQGRVTSAEVATQLAAIPIFIWVGRRVQYN